MKYIIIILILSMLVGCNNKPENMGLPSVAALIEQCESPTLYLYPAINAKSEVPEFFDNTTYEIIMNGEYLGKFPADRFNESYLNLTAGDVLQVVVSAKDKDCFIYNVANDYQVSYEPIQYLTPSLVCADEFRFYAYNPDTLSNVKEENVKSHFDRAYVILRINGNNRYDEIGCTYDKRYIRSYDVSDSQITLSPKGLTMKYQLYETYHLEGNEEVLEFDYINVPVEQINTTVICTIFDTDYIISEYHIADDIYIGDKDVGQENPSFNFTIQWE